MQKFIILSDADVRNLSNNEPVKLYVDQIPYVICTDKYYNDVFRTATKQWKWKPLLQESEE